MVTRPIRRPKVRPARSSGLAARRSRRTSPVRLGFGPRRRLGVSVSWYLGVSLSRRLAGSLSRCLGVLVSRCLGVSPSRWLAGSLAPCLAASRVVASEDRRLRPASRPPRVTGLASCWQPRVVSTRARDGDSPVADVARSDDAGPDAPVDRTAYGRVAPPRAHRCAADDRQDGCAGPAAAADSRRSGQDPGGVRSAVATTVPAPRR